LEQLYEEYRNGATIVLPFVHERSRSVALLCSAFAAHFNAQLQANAYLTPPSSTGLGLHYDTHDVLVLQLEGHKHWQLYDPPVRLPLPGQPYRSDRHEPSGPKHEFDLQAGDLLYLPRGYLHRASTTDETSLHLTVGIIPITWAEILLASVEFLIENDSSLREALPLGFARSKPKADLVARKFESVATNAAGQIRDYPALRYALDRALLVESPQLDGHLIDLEEVDGLTMDTAVSRRPGFWIISVTEGLVTLHAQGKLVTMPIAAEKDIRFIDESSAPFNARDLPGDLDESGRLTLVRRLVRESLLTLSRES